MLAAVLFLVLLVLLALAVLVELLVALEALVARLALDEHLRDGARVRSYGLRPLLIKHILGDGRELRDSSLSIVNVKLRGQMQFIVDYLIEPDVACGADDGLALGLNALNLLLVQLFHFVLHWII